MEAINFLTNWTRYLIVVIPVGAGAMVTYQALRKTLTDDESVIGDCNSKIKNTIYGAVIGMTMSGLITVLKRFYM